MKHMVLGPGVEGRSLGHVQRLVFAAGLKDLPPDLEAVLIRWTAGGPSVPGPDLPHADDCKGPDLRALCHMIETASCPVFVLITGAIGGAAAELALAAHGRMATPSARMQFASAKLGLIPSGGTTQRLSRLVGAEEALRLLSTGTVVGAGEALAMGLIDEVIEGDGDDGATLSAALARIAVHVAAGAVPPPGLARGAGLRDGRAFLAAVAAMRAKTAPEDACQSALIDCVEAAMLLPPDQGLEFERSLAADLAAAPRSQALCHIHRAEARGAKIPAALRDFSPAPVRRLGVWGAAPAFAGVVLTALSCGLGVTMVEGDKPRLVSLLKAIAARQEAAVTAGRLTAVQRDADWARLQAVTESGALETTDFVLVAAEAQVPPAQIAALVAQRKGRAVLITGRAEVPSGAFRLILNGRVAEIALPPGAPAQPAAQAFSFLRQLGLTVLPVGVQSPAGIAGRLGAAGAGALRAMLAMGVTVEAIVGALSAFGLRPPTLAGLEGVTPRAMPPEEIVNRWLGALANEGARLLSAGMAQSPLDIDLVAVAGMGFPRDKGGPLHQADQRGLMVVRRDLTLWADEGEVWKPLPAWDALVSLGRGFAAAASRE